MSTAEQDRSASRRRGWVIALLAPHLAALVCLVVARNAMIEIGTNRGETDLQYGSTGLLLALGAIVATLIALAIRPWRGARGSDWVWTGIHVVALAAALKMASDWLGAHIA